jgi:predicted GIY-YIG superfamily endonuclease
VTQSARKRAKAGRYNLEMLAYTVYILECRDGYYVGCTDNLDDRLERHTKGRVPATKNRLPLKLTNTFGFNDKYKAFNFERYLKSGSGRAFSIKHL